MQLTPYEGDEDYIFISYSHRDMELVVPILRYLQKEGIRFWHDEGINPGSEWPESIARHLSSCRGCMAFISSHSLDSQNCRREINYALAKEKEFLSIILEPVEMSPGMEMQISSYQSLMKYRYPNDETFLARLMKVELIKDCLEVPAEIEPSTVTVGEPPKIIEKPEPKTELKIVVEPKDIVEPEIIIEPKNIIESDPTSPNPDPSKPQLSRKTLLTACGILAALLVLVLVLVLPKGPSQPDLVGPSSTGDSSSDPGPSKAEDVSGEAPASSQQYVYTLRKDSLYEENVDDEDFEQDNEAHFVFGSAYTRNQISSITFLDSLDGCPDDAWDVSRAWNGSIMAWVEPNGELFDLYIGAKGRMAAPSDCFYLFAGYEHLRTIRFNGIFDTSRTTSMDEMFRWCGSLEELDLSGFDTGEVGNMDGMFSGCRSLKTLDLSGFDTSNVTEMNGMFGGCGSLERLDLSSFNTVSAARMRDMFSDCGSLEELDLSSFKTAGVTDMACMFKNCGSLKGLDLRSFNTAKVTDMQHMFSGCGSLETLDLSSFDTANVTDMSFMFWNCGGLKELDVSRFDTARVTDMGHMFSDCGSLTALDLSSFDLSSRRKTANCMFSNCERLTTLKVVDWNTSDVETYEMFDGCALPQETVSAILSGNTVSIG